MVIQEARALGEASSLVTNFKLKGLMATMSAHWEPRFKLMNLW